MVKAFCPTCQRFVFSEDEQELVCPVCCLPLLQGQQKPIAAQ